MRLTDWAQYPEQEFFYKHCLLLLLEFKSGVDGRIHKAHASGFMAKIDGEYCLFTAGHVLTDIEQNLNDGHTLEKTSILDFGHEQHLPLPIHWDGTLKVVINNEQGFDAAAIQIKQPYANALIKNGVVPLTIMDCRQVDDECLGYVVVGVPDEWREFGGDDNEPWIYMVHPIFPLEFIREFEGKDGSPQYRFKIELEGITADGKPLKRIEGISGGPIFGLWKTSKGHKVYGVGLQSSWNPTSLECTVTPLEYFFKFLHLLAEE